MRGVILSLVLLAAGPAVANDAAVLRAAMARSAAGDHAGAVAEARRSRDPVVLDLALWRRGVDGDAEWGELAGLLSRRADWPRRAALRANAERAMPAGLPARDVVAFFAEEAPRTGAGAIRLAGALEAQGQTEAARGTIARAWTTFDLSGAERQTIQDRWPAVARGLATERLDALLWRGAANQAEALFPLVDPGWRALAEARIALRARRPGVDGLIARVPAALSNDPGLAYERFLWRELGGRAADAEQLLAQRTGSAAALGQPEVWATRRAAIVRRALRDGRVAEAYRFASQHHLTEGSAFADLEWLAGWIALRHLRDPARAAAHFETLWNAVGTPISRGRAGFWAGRAREAMGDAAGARTWWLRAAEHATAFYGQLAAERAGVDVTAALAARDGVADWRRGAFAGGDTARAIQLLHQAGEPAMTRQFLVALSAAQTRREDIAAVGALALALDRPDAAVAVGKAAAQRGEIIMDIYFPVTSMAAADGPVEPAFAKSIARQESEFNSDAVSRAGARGVMQLMPATAQAVARDLGLAFDNARLTADPVYNARLGKAYLARRMAQYGGARILAAAAYNAGAGRVDEWLGRFGDPRSPNVDALDWIETIPFTETRNYVQRVMEGLHIYRARLGAPMSPVGFAASLTDPRG
ncbi:MAG: lytic transglycosylase domain-containing protein [Rhodobacteraceae bacterium]|nr:MAG: lytic transglycosylase domain-containing protein [Paracoccaceae bacterium]